MLKRKELLGMDIYKTKVLLPSHLFQEAKDESHLNQLIVEYMVRYPDYEIKEIENGFAICTKYG